MYDTDECHYEALHKINEKKKTVRFIVEWAYHKRVRHMKGIYVASFYSIDELENFINGLRSNGKVRYCHWYDIWVKWQPYRFKDKW